MCRFTLYLGPAVRLSGLLIEPRHSLILQSYRSEERAEPLNGDGFGVGWYAPRLSHEPAVFHAITPAWNNRNLASISQAVASPCILAHVRAATPGMEVDLANCHPFQYGSYLLMHNGSIGGFTKVRRQLLDELTDEAFGMVRGSTDTEHLFAVFVDELVRNGCPVDPKHGNGSRPTDDDAPDAALELARRLSNALARVLSLVREFADGAPSFLNVAVADGHHAAVSRFTNHPTEKPESLHYLMEELYEPTGRRFPQRRAGDEGEAVVVSSERLTDDPEWQDVPVNSMVVLGRYHPMRIFRLTDSGRIDA
ncbi:MAG: class II glutamine amidotransferase [Gemmatimonadetes bacterium]|nr:class II glutamine amidotransferase [Gemmatimonadota bacterium]